VYGPRQDPRSRYSGVISIFAENIIQKRPLQIYGDGRQTRDFIFVNDVVNHLIVAMKKIHPSASTYNVCTGTATSLLDLIGYLSRDLAYPPDLVFQAARPSDILYSRGSPEKAIRDLGVRAAVDISDGLKHLVAWLFEQHG